MKTKFFYGNPSWMGEALYWLYNIGLLIAAIAILLSLGAFLYTFKVYHLFRFFVYLVLSGFMDEARDLYFRGRHANER